MDSSITDFDGTLNWYQNDKLHREDGPAIICPSGEYWWCLDGIRYNFDDYCDKLGLSGEDRLLLRIQYG